VLILASVLAIIAGIQLYILTEYTDHFFAWTIAQPLSATFLGTGYWTGAALLLFAAREKAWANIRVALAAVGAFVHASAQEEPLEGSMMLDWKPAIRSPEPNLEPSSPRRNTLRGPAHPRTRVCAVLVDSGAGG
jgi:hypothetical protein